MQKDERGGLQRDRAVRKKNDGKVYGWGGQIPTYAPHTQNTCKTMERVCTHSTAQRATQEVNALVIAIHVWRRNIVLHFCVVAGLVLLRLAIESLSFF